MDLPMIMGRRFLFSIVSAITLIPSFAGAEESLSYEKPDTVLKGVLVKETYQGKDAEPPLKGSTSWILKLEKPISVKANPESPEDTEEKNVKEVQLALGNAKVEAADLKKYAAEKVRISVTGSLYHAHTAYHVRPVLTLVSTVTLVKAELERK